MNKVERKQIAERRLRELQTLALQAGVVVNILNEWPMHVRVYGENRVDYWPSTGKAWVFDTQANAAHYSPSEVIALAGIRSSAVAEGEIQDPIKPLGRGPLEPDATAPEADTAHPSHQRDPDTLG